MLVRPKFHSSDFPVTYVTEYGLVTSTYVPISVSVFYRHIPQQPDDTTFVRTRCLHDVPYLDMSRWLNPCNFPARLVADLPVNNSPCGEVTSKSATSRVTWRRDAVVEFALYRGQRSGRVSCLYMADKLFVFYLCPSTGRVRIGHIRPPSGTVPSLTWRAGPGRRQSQSVDAVVVNMDSI